MHPLLGAQFLKRLGFEGEHRIIEVGPGQRMPLPQLLAGLRCGLAFPPAQLHDRRTAPRLAAAPSSRMASPSESLPPPLPLTAPGRIWSRRTANSRSSADAPSLRPGVRPTAHRPPADPGESARPPQRDARAEQPEQLLTPLAVNFMATGFSDRSFFHAEVAHHLWTLTGTGLTAPP